MKFPNWKGEIVDAPSDYPTVLASTPDETLVWSHATREERPAAGPERHKVRYCLQVETFAHASAAAAHFSNCMSHKLACEGLK